MGNMPIPKKASSALAVESTRRSDNRGLIKLLGTDDFKTDLSRLKNSIAMGKTLEEARLNLGILNAKRWKYLLDALGRMTVSRERLYLEFRSRTQIRYSQATEIMQRHGPYKLDKQGRVVRDNLGNPVRNPDGDTDMESKMLLLLCKIDEQVVDLADKMGLLKPTLDDDTGGEGYTDEEVRRELERYDQIIRDQLVSGSISEQPIRLEEKQAGEVNGDSKAEISKKD